MARRPRPAAASRLLATGISTSATFVIVAVLASGAPATSAAATATRAAAVAVAPTGPTTSTTAAATTPFGSAGRGRASGTHPRHEPGGGHHVRLGRRHPRTGRHRFGRTRAGRRHTGRPRRTQHARTDGRADAAADHSTRHQPAAAAPHHGWQLTGAPRSEDVVVRLARRGSSGGHCSPRPSCGASSSRTRPSGAAPRRPGSSTSTATSAASRVAFVVVHLAVLPLDTFTDWGWRDLFVPLASHWHPVPIAFGIVAFYVLLAVEVSSLLGRRVPTAWWRRIHFLSFPLYVMASVHLFAAGTDSGNAVARWTVVVVSTLIAFLTVIRALAAARPRPTSSGRIPAAARGPRCERPLRNRPPTVDTPKRRPPSPREVHHAPPTLPTAPRPGGRPAAIRVLAGRPPAVATAPAPGDLLPTTSTRARGGSPSPVATSVDAATTVAVMGRRPRTLEERAAHIRAMARAASRRATR